MIEHNHDWKSIKNYSLAQIGLFINECRKRDRVKMEADHVNGVYNVWVGTHYNAKGIKEFMNKYSKNFTTKPDNKSTKKGWGALQKLFMKQR